MNSFSSNQETNALHCDTLTSAHLGFHTFVYLVVLSKYSNYDFCCGAFIDAKIHQPENLNHKSSQHIICMLYAYATNHKFIVAIYLLSMKHSSSAAHSFIWRNCFGCIFAARSMVGCLRSTSFSNVIIFSFFFSWVENWQIYAFVTKRCTIFPVIHLITCVIRITIHFH